MGGARKARSDATTARDERNPWSVLRFMFTSDRGEILRTVTGTGRLIGGTRRSVEAAKHIDDVTPICAPQDTIEYKVTADGVEPGPFRTLVHPLTGRTHGCR